MNRPDGTGRLRDALATLPYAVCALAFLAGLAVAGGAILPVTGSTGALAGLIVSGLGYCGMKALEPRDEN